VRLYRRYRLPITQVLILLKPTDRIEARDDRFQVEQTQHQFQIIRLWEQDPFPLLSDPALLPLAVLAAMDSPEQLLYQVANQVGKIEAPEIRRETLTCAQVLAGLRFDKQLIQRIFREGVMRESVIYQEIIQEGLAEGRQQGLQQGKQQEAASLALRLLSRRLGAVDPALQDQIQQLSVEQVEDLVEAVLDFSQSEDLNAWLRQNG
jgi:predicted transposase YdaD